ncbi:putative Secreted Protein [Cryptosporidium felis]|nr:putative Secreted Protein [Cryptosporidium felis]
MRFTLLLFYFGLLTIRSVFGYQVNQVKVTENASEKELLAALCWSLPFKFIKCDIDFEEKVLKHLKMAQIPRYKVSSTDEVVYNIRMQPLTNGFVTNALLAVRSTYGLIISNDVGNPVSSIPHQLKQSSTAIFGLPHQAKNVFSSVNCVLMYSSIGEGFYYILPGKSEHKSIPRSVPENIVLKASSEKTRTREMFYMTLLANQQFPVKPTGSYGVGTEFLIPPVVCFGTEENLNQQLHEKKSYLGGILIHERVMGPSLRDIIKFFKSTALLNWLSSSSTSEFSFKARVSLRLEAQLSLLHALIAAILTLQHHSIAGRLLHCDLNTKSIHIDRIVWSWSSRRVEENLNALTQLSPANIKFTNFGYMKSTLETSEETLRCSQTDNDLVRVKQFIKAIFSEQSNRTDFPESGTLSSGMLTMSTGIKLWWKDVVNTVGEPTNREITAQEILEVEAILRTVHSEPSVITNLEKVSTFQGIVSGIKAIHASLSKSFRHLCDQGLTKTKSRVVHGWSTRDLEPEPPTVPSSTVRNILGGKKVDPPNKQDSSAGLDLELSAESIGIQ